MKFSLESGQDIMEEKKMLLLISTSEEMFGHMMNVCVCEREKVFEFFRTEVKKKGT